MTVSSDFPAGAGLRVAEYGTGARVVTVVGQIDVPTALELTTSLIAQLAVSRVVVVNLDGVSYLGSAGLLALFEANEFAAQKDRILRLVCNSRVVNRALVSSGLRDYFTFVDSVPENFTGMQGVVEAGVARRLRRRRSRRSRLRDTAAIRESVRTGPN